MTLPSLDQRAALADKIHSEKQIIAEAVTDEFFNRHPDWLTRYGSMGRIRGIEDARYHLEFLAGAIESGSVASFQDYVRWTMLMLQARQIEPHFVVENLTQIEHSLGPRLSDQERVLVSAFVQAGQSVSPVASPELADGAAQTGLSLTRQLFVQASLQGQRQAATNIVLEAFNGGHPVLKIYEEVIQNSLYEVGRLWQTNQITVAEEHMATSIAQFVLAQLYPLVPLPELPLGTAVITGVEGELHQVGANMVADALEANGWTVHFLGTNMPAAGILKVIDETHADVVGVSATMLFNLPKVRTLITDARSHCRARPLLVFVGGAAFRSAPNLPSEMGADGFASDLHSVVALFTLAAAARSARVVSPAWREPQGGRT